MAKQALKVIKGATLSNSFRYESPKKLYKVITSISNAAPIVITSVAHGLPSVWRAKVTNVLGMVEINSSDEYYEVTKLTSDTLEINSINSVGFKTYLSGGILEYNEPVDLTGYTARMQIREDIDATTFLLELTNINGGIVIDTANSTVTIYMSASDTASITWEKAVYSLELVSPAGVVIPFLDGAISSIKEVTR